MDLNNPAIPSDLRNFLKDIAIPPEEEAASAEEVVKHANDNNRRSLKGERGFPCHLNVIERSSRSAFSH